MRQQGVALEVDTFSATINACEKGHRWEGALQLLWDMFEKGFTPDTIAFNAAVSACSKAKQWAHAWQLLNEM